VTRRINVADLSEAAQKQAVDRYSIAGTPVRGKSPDRSLHTRFELWCETMPKDCVNPPLPEYQFDEPELRTQRRRWRFDYCWPSYSGGLLRGVCVDIEGGLYVQGAHSRGAQIEGDHEKRNAAAAQGWLVILIGPKAVKSGQFMPALERCLRRAGCWK
jgi:hypothetical protein